MGTNYYIICQDCPEILNLYKFWDWRIIASNAQLDEDTLIKGQEELFRYLESGDHYWRDWVKSASRILAFLSVHNGHRITIVDEDNDLIRATRLEKMMATKEPDVEYCMCGHHFRTHMDTDYSWKDSAYLASCCLCSCEQFVSTN